MLSMALVFVMIVCLVPPVETEASSKPWFPKKHNQYYYEKNQSSNTTTFVFGDELENYKITDLKSSNKKVLTVSTFYDSYTYLDIRARAPGKATITFKAKVGSKTYSYKCNVVVHKYENPAKSLKIGKTNYASEFSYIEYFTLRARKNLKGKLAITTNKNWKIKDIEVYDYRTTERREVKNNKTITLNKGQVLWVTFINKKTGAQTITTLSNEKW